MMRTFCGGNPTACATCCRTENGACVPAHTVILPFFTPAVVPAHPAALALALVLERLQQAAPVRIAFATLLQPASEFGRAALDELHQQTMSLLSFQGMPRNLYDAQAAYNLLAGLGESAKVSLGDRKSTRLNSSH